EQRLLEAISSPEWTEDRFQALALLVYRFQRKHNPAYDQFSRHLGAATDPDDWRNIPAVPQGMFKRYALRSFPPALTTVIFRTSGTTGEQQGCHYFLSTRL